jgi:hypothetical protein
MKKSPNAAVIVGVLVPLGIFACINIRGTSLTGESKLWLPLMQPKELRAMMTEQPVAALQKLDLVALDGNGNDYDSAVLRAVQAVVAGRLDEGIGALVALEEKYPGFYSTASNLGTAYELKGDNRKALQWIAEGIRRNPLSHDGTEWLHVLILETKLKLEQNPNWLRSHRVLELDETRLTHWNAPTPVIEVEGRKFNAKEVWSALHHQLRERMLLVKPKDAIVADLLYTESLVQAHQQIEATTKKTRAMIPRGRTRSRAASSVAIAAASVAR